MPNRVPSSFLQGPSPETKGLFNAVVLDAFNSHLTTYLHIVLYSARKCLLAGSGFRLILHHIGHVSLNRLVAHGLSEIHLALPPANTAFER